MEKALQKEQYSGLTIQDQNNIMLQEVEQVRLSFGTYRTDKMSSEGSMICEWCVQRLEYSKGPTIVEEMNCTICKGLRIDSLKIAEKALVKLSSLEFETFLVGCRIDEKVLSQEKSYNKGLALDLKTALREYFTEYFETKMNRTVDRGLPEVNILLDTVKNRYELDIRSLYLLGKYQKLTRGLPQTKWPCSNCKGRKCESCNFTGQQYPKTVETVIAPLFEEAAKAKSSSFHGAGREDIDALMLGEGRPFVLELKFPQVRSIDLEKLQEEVNKQDDVKISLIRYTNKDAIIELKQSSPDSKKSYRAIVEFESEVFQEDANIINEFGAKENILEQRTPQRVSHRRADAVRRKSIFSVQADVISPTSMNLEIHAQGGAYIKEFISGDEGRTLPSISSLTGKMATCTALDVTWVDDRGVFSS
jgi:tRNA pseudouridine synthase 10